MSEYERGFSDGFTAAYDRFVGEGGILERFHDRKQKHPGQLTRNTPKPHGGKRKQSGKQKILTQMAKKAWDKYKKGNGRKSYITIRAEVSRSQAYKKKTKGM